MRTIKIAHDDWDIDLAPGLGGAVLSCKYKGQPILRETSNTGDMTPTDTSCFLLVPFSNRIAQGEFNFGETRVSMPSNLPGEPHAIHGSGWTSEWHMSEQSQDHCQMRYNHAADDWPWDFTADWRVSVDGNVAAFTLSIKNIDKKPMPAGLGFHPYFDSLKTAALSFSSQGVWLNDDTMLPEKWITTPEPWQFAAPKPLKGVISDNCFTGWNGRAQISWTDRPYEVKVDSSAAFAVLYTQAKDDYFCFEPVSHMNNGVNWDGRSVETGVKHLGPGETLRLEMRLQVERKPPS